MCIQLSYDFTNENYLSFGVNGESNYYLWKWVLKMFCSRLESKFNDNLQSNEEKSKQDLLHDNELTQKGDTSLGLLDNMSGNEIF